MGLSTSVIIVLDNNCSESMMIKYNQQPGQGFQNLVQYTALWLAFRIIHKTAGLTMNQKPNTKHACQSPVFHKCFWFCR